MPAAISHWAAKTAMGFCYCYMQPTAARAHSSQELRHALEDDGVEHLLLHDCLESIQHDLLTRVAVEDLVEATRRQARAHGVTNAYAYKTRADGIAHAVEYVPTIPDATTPRALEVVADRTHSATQAFARYKEDLFGERCAWRLSNDSRQVMNLYVLC